MTNPSEASNHTSPIQWQDAGLPKVLIGVGVVTYLLACALLASLFSPLPILAHLLVLAGLYVAWRWPVGLIAIILLLVPFQPLPTLALKAAGHEWVVALSSIKEFGMLGAAVVLAWRRRIKLCTLDSVLLSLLVWAVLISIVRANSSTLIGLKDDFDFVIPFYAGRLILLDKGWIKSGLWVAALVATLGLVEFFWVGPGPRMLLTGISDPAELATSYTATGFSGFRAASTLSGPLALGAFCAIELLSFAAFYRDLSWKYVIPAALLTGGLVVSVTRMAWLAVLIGLIAIGVHIGQKLKLFLFVTISTLAMALIVVPSLGLEDYIAATQRGYDPSAEGHIADLIERSSFVLSHPLGVGAGMVGPRALELDSKALHVESSYLQLGMAYGWPGILLFVAFLAKTLAILRKKKSTFGVAALAVALAMSTMYFFSPLHEAFDVNGWAWALIGFGISDS